MLGYPRSAIAALLLSTLLHSCKGRDPDMGSSQVAADPAAGSSTDPAGGAAAQGGTPSPGTPSTPGATPAPAAPPASPLPQAGPGPNPLSSFMNMASGALSMFGPMLSQLGQNNLAGTTGSNAGTSGGTGFPFPFPFPGLGGGGGGGLFGGGLFGGGLFGKKP